MSYLTKGIMTNPKVSILLSIYNRGELLDLGLQSLLAQTMPTNEWEIILADDMSTEDLSKVYSKYPFNVTHIRFNPKSHPNYKGYHTQSLALNLAAKQARGEVLLISQPEMLHDAENLMRGYEEARKVQTQPDGSITSEIVYGLTILSHPKFTETVLETGYTDFNALWDEANKLAQPFTDNELYWYIAFVKREHFMSVHGVEESYMEGVYAEDDEFKNRLGYYGVLPILDRGIRGIHINHEYEGDLYSKQDRHTSFWAKGAERNRKKYFDWLEASKAEGVDQKQFIAANQHLGDDWGHEKYIVEIKEQKI